MTILLLVILTREENFMRSVAIIPSFPEWPHSQGGCLTHMLKLQDRFPVELRMHRFILCTRRSEDTAYNGGRCDQSIGFTVSDAIVCSWFGRLQGEVPHWNCKSLIIDSTFCGGRFSTGKLLAIEDFTFSRTLNRFLSLCMVRNIM